MVDAKLERGSLAEWASGNGGLLYTMQSLVDLRQESRWFPDFVSPEQLGAEFVGRILIAAERHRASIEGGELGALIWGGEIRLPNRFAFFVFRCAWAA